MNKRARKKLGACGEANSIDLLLPEVTSRIEAAEGDFRAERSHVPSAAMSSASDPTTDDQRARRANLRVRVISRLDDVVGQDTVAMTPDERVAMMWPLAQSAWAVTNQGSHAESRLPRHVGRVQRRRR